MNYFCILLIIFVVIEYSIIIIIFCASRFWFGGRCITIVLVNFNFSCYNITHSFYPFLSILILILLLWPQFFVQIFIASLVHVGISGYPNVSLVWYVAWWRFIPTRYIVSVAPTIIVVGVLFDSVTEWLVHNVHSTKTSIVTMWSVVIVVELLATQESAPSTACTSTIKSSSLCIVMHLWLLRHGLIGWWWLLWWSL